MLITGRKFLDATNSGLDILKHYLAHEFELNTEVVVGEVKFKVAYNDTYQNYVIYVYVLENGKWVSDCRLNPIWFVKEKYGLTEEETYIKIQNDLQLDVLPVAKRNKTPVFLLNI